MARTMHEDAKGRPRDQRQVEDEPQRVYCSLSCLGGVMQSATKLLACTLAIGSSLTSAAPAPAQRMTDGPVPSFRDGTPYSQVRQRLRRAGWTPYRPARSCATYSARCAEYPEALLCAMGAQATCWFAWQRGRQSILIATGGEGVAFDELRSCGAVVVNDDHPWQWCRAAASMGGGSSAAVQGSATGDVRTYALRNANARRGPGTGFSVAYTIPAGESVSVDGAVGEWCITGIPEAVYIRCDLLAAPRGGWVPGVTVQRIRPGSWGD
jgi:hypothetical protein